MKNNSALHENSCFIIANLIADSEEALTTIFNMGFLKIIEDEIDEDQMRIAMMRTLAWMMGNAMKGNHTDVAIIESSLNIMSTLMFVPDAEANNDIVCAFMYLTNDREGESKDIIDMKLNYIFETNIIPKLVSLLAEDFQSKQYIAKTLGNI